MYQIPFDPNIKAHVDNYQTLLATGRDVPIDSLIPNYLAFQPILHRFAASDTLDLDALSFSVARLPPDIFTITKVIFVQSYEDIKSFGFDFTQWTRTTSPGRRRLIFVNPSKNTLACLLSSPSDLHDMVNCLISFYIERQKIGRLINNNYKRFVQKGDLSILKLDQTQLAKLQQIFGLDWQEKLNTASLNNPLILKLYGRDNPLYQVNSSNWMHNLVNHSLVLGLNQIPIYFVSSNSHGLVNIIGGFVNSKQNYIFDYVSHNNNKLYEQWFEVKRNNNLSRVNDFLYYVAPAFLKDNPQFIQEKNVYEQRLGIIKIDSSDAFQSSTHLIPIKSFASSVNPDSNLNFGDISRLEKSDAYILNIEYPLGYAAYYLLNEIFNTFQNLQAVYIMGKAAILTGNVGDIQIPTTVFDEMTDNCYTFNNVFNNTFNFKTFISNIYLNQKEACVYNTYLENKVMVDQYTQAQVNVIEMENGPYLKSLTEKYLLNGSPAAPKSQYDLSELPLDFGVINYASDNPLVQNLTQESTTLQGVEPVYLASLATLQRIIDREHQRLSHI